MSGMRITLQRLGTPTEGTGAEGAAATGEVVAWRDGYPAPDEPAVGTSDDSAAPPRDSTARLALAPEHPRVSARGETPETVRVVVIVPFREDGSGRESQLSALLARLRSMFLPGECLVVVAEQADDGRKFNRGQLLNAAFAHVRETLASRLDARDTLYCFHDCDMLPDASLAAHYLRGPPAFARFSREENDDASSSSSSSIGGFVRVLCADGGRYDADACFGGVTIYDRQGFEATNGYPNGFWGGGGEDNAQFLRCARAGLALERVRGCPFDDLEGLATVTEKLARLDAAGARCGAKETKQLLRENARAWRTDGLASVAFESSVPTATRVETYAEKEDDGAPARWFAFRLRAAIADEVACAECGERKGPSGFASHQHKRAMFYAARDRKTGSVDRVSGRSGDASREVPERETPRETARESFWRERNRVARLCHWDERGGEGVMRDPSHPSDPSDPSDPPSSVRSAPEKRVASHENRVNNIELTETSVSSKPSSAKRSARCLACVAKDPRTSAFRKQAERNDADATRTTCARCGARFEKRNRLFEHLKASPCGVRDGEVIEGHVSS